MRRLMVALVLLALLLVAGGTLAAEEAPPSTGTFSSAGSLSEPRDGSAATLLSDGRVLVVGGFAWPVSLMGLLDPEEDLSEGMSPSVEVWDPTTNGFTLAGALLEGREGHTATLLPDGRVLVVGGAAYDHLLASAEVWDPSTDESTSTGPLKQVRRDHTATLLPDGRVLVIGGDGFAQRSLTHAKAEVWDPTTGGFTPAGSLKEPRTYHTATLLADGRVLVAGGTDWFGERKPSREVEVWDPATNRFARTGSLPEARIGHSATLLTDGRVLIVGGGWDKDPPTTALVWDPGTGKFSAAGSLPEARLNHTATLLPDGRVLIVGGEDIDLPPDDDVFASALVWDPATDEFSPAGSLAEARAGHTALPLDDGRVLVVGGYGEDGLVTDMEVWEPSSAGQ